MYFLAEDEKRFVLRRLIPQARQTDIAAELRGWNWHQPPLSPIYDARLALYEIAGAYCRTGRDVYLRRVLGVKPPPNHLMAEGIALHAALAHLILSVKRILYGESPRELQRLAEPDSSFLGQLSLPTAIAENAREKIAILWDFEYHRIVVRVQEILARQPYIGPDALVALAVPVTVEQKLDGAFLGLSSHLSADAFIFSEPMLVDLKFGERQDFDRMTTTGYALVMESLYEFPINLGCVVHVKFKDGRLLVDRDFHLIDDELRQWFIEARDEKMRIVSEEIDPGKPDECYAHCVYCPTCHPK
ncbi:MAG: type I-A CRISPR-associated protein Cas4/Csa1 [Dehalococcoidales bacterium]|nr:type I-A CRISPR-associated protein Cas4/Csa1 [Dehalococcoidales bacterium]